MSITEQQYSQFAQQLDCEMEALKAVAEVESKGNAFNADGTLVVLFEPHIFSRYTRHKFDQSHPDISYPEWRKGAYGPQSAQWGRLQKAATLDKHAAYLSASYGVFQIMGFNYGAAGYLTVEDMVAAFQAGELAHYEAFTNFIKARSLEKFLRSRDWAGFAERYNGEGYRDNKYDTKMAAAYRRLKKSRAR